MRDLAGDFPWVSGRFEPTNLDDIFRGLFAFLVDEDGSTDEPPFADELLDEEQWWLADGRGKRWGISLPAVHLDDGTIAWRWRGERPHFKGAS